MAERASNEARERGHETADVSERNILRVGGALLVVVLLAALVVWWLTRHLFAEHVPHASISSSEQPLGAFPTPRLEQSPSQDIATFRAEKRAMLNGYRWIDKNRGIVQIPIERAMALLAARPVSPNPTAARPIKKEAVEQTTRDAGTAGNTSSRENEGTRPAESGAQHANDGAARQ